MNPDLEAGGALHASYSVGGSKSSNVQVIGYRYLNDLSCKPEQRAQFESDISTRKNMNILDDAEVKDLVLQKIRNIPEAIQVHDV